MLGSACDCASECILNSLKAFYLGGGQCVIKNKSSGNGGGSTVVYSVANAPKITYTVVEGTCKGGDLLRKGKGRVEDETEIFSKGSGRDRLCIG